MRELPLVTVVMPCFNEKKHISGCLDSVIDNDYPKDRLEVVVIDGLSDDGTRGILEDYAVKYGFIHVVDNPKRITPAGLNAGIKKAKGDVIIRMDAHSAYARDYISKCVKYLNEFNADNVGGVWVTVPRGDSVIAKTISLCLSHPFGVGNARYRIGWDKEPKWVDTVPFGCFRRDIFEKIGFFNEDLHRNEDIDFNARIRKSGGRILLVPDIIMKYYVRSKFSEFIKHSFDNGVKVTYPFVLHKNILSWRHMVPLVFVSVLFMAAGMATFSGLHSPVKFAGLLTFGSIILIYLATSIYFSLKTVQKEKDLRLLFFMPFVFLSLHLSYGLGSIWGLVRSALRVVR